MRINIGVASRVTLQVVWKRAPEDLDSTKQKGYSSSWSKVLYLFRDCTVYSAASQSLKILGVVYVLHHLQ